MSDYREAKVRKGPQLFNTSRFESHLLAMYWAKNDPRVPWYAKMLTANSIVWPFEFFFLPVMLITPVVFKICSLLSPHGVMDEYRTKAVAHLDVGPPPEALRTLVIVSIGIWTVVPLTIWALLS